MLEPLFVDPEPFCLNPHALTLNPFFVDPEPLCLDSEPFFVDPDPLCQNLEQTWQRVKQKRWKSLNDTRSNHNAPYGPSHDMLSIQPKLALCI